MRQAIRALGWASKIFWIVITVFMITCLYSAIGLMTSGGVHFDRPEASFSNETAMVSLPFSFNNTGLYDISDMNITTRIADYNGTLISTSTTFVPLIPHGSNVEEVHNVSISLGEIVSKNATYLLFDSGNFSIEIFAGLIFARTFPFQISTNASMPWGAPFSNFSIGEVSFDYVNRKVIVPLGFKNDSPYFDVSANIHFGIYNHENVLVHSDVITPPLEVKSGDSHEDQLELSVGSSVDLLELTERGRIHFSFETSIFGFEKEIKWGDVSD
jgi:hypothetical protein